MERPNLIGVIGRDNVGMCQPGRSAHFAPETLNCRGILQQRRLGDLQGNEPPHETVLGLEDAPHSPRPDGAEDSITWMVEQLGRNGRLIGGEKGGRVPAGRLGRNCFVRSVEFADKLVEVLRRHSGQPFGAGRAAQEVLFDRLPARSAQPPAVELRKLGGAGMARPRRGSYFLGARVFAHLNISSMSAWE
jgi:hypothetical protein